MPVGLQGARELPRAPDPVPIPDAAAVAALVVLELAAVWLVLRIWRERGRSLGARLLWSVVTLVPVLGLIAWAAWRDPPPPKGPTDRPGGRDWDLGD